MDYYCLLRPYRRLLWDHLHQSHRGGSAVINMVGQRCNITSVRLKGYVYVTAGAGSGAFGMCRLMLVYDRQTSQGTPTLANILSNTNTDTLVTAWSGTDIPNEQRFTVLRDQVITLEPNHSIEAFDLYAKGMFLSSATTPGSSSLATPQEHSFSSPTATHQLTPSPSPGAHASAFGTCDQATTQRKQ